MHTYVLIKSDYIEKEFWYDKKVLLYIKSFKITDTTSNLESKIIL